MLNFGPNTRIFVGLDPVDMRGSFDALAGHVRRLRADPLDLPDPRLSHLELPPHLGAGAAKLDEMGVVITVGETPLAEDLTAHFRARGVDLPKQFEHHRCWLVTFGVNVESGAAYLARLGFQVEYPEQTGQRTLTVLDLLPRAEVVQRAHAKGDSEFSVNARIGMDGVALPVNPVAEGGTSASASSSLEAGFHVEFAVESPRIEAVGTFGRRSWWEIHRTAGAGLGGRTLVFKQVILLPVDTKEVTAIVGVSAAYQSRLLGLHLPYTTQELMGVSETLTIPLRT